MLSPGEDVVDTLAAKSRNANRAVAADEPNAPSDERLELLRGEMNRRTFHDCVLTRWRSARHWLRIGYGSSKDRRRVAGRAHAPAVRGVTLAWNGKRGNESAERRA